MRIYKSDGTFIENKEDTEFGWYFNEITIDESIESYERRNKETHSIAALKKTVKPDKNFECSIEEPPSSTPGNIFKIQQIEPNIKIHQTMESVVEPNLELESIPNTYENIDNKVPSKSQMASLINPCSAESKMLLSVVHHAKYRNLVKDVINLGDLRDNKKIKILINHKSDNLERDLRREMQNYHKIKDESMLSLMMELILSDMRCDVSDIADRHESSDLGNSITSDDHSSSSSSASSSQENVSWNRERASELWSNTGVSEAIDYSIGKICEETYDIHLKILQIRKNFQEDEIRLNRLIGEAQNFEKSLRETKFLDDLLHLLDGKLDKVKINNSPFRIFLPNNSDETESNLII